MGQNTESHGTISNSKDFSYALSFSTLTQRDEALYKGAIHRIIDRGLIGNIKFIVNELIVSYRDGLLDHHERHIQTTDYNEKLQSLIGQLILSKGKNFQIYAGISQVLWDMILLLMLISCIFIRNKIHFVVALIVIGFNMYILLFENRACYVYMFVPYIAIIAMISLNEMSSMRRLLKCKK